MNNLPLLYLLTGVAIALAWAVRTVRRGPEAWAWAISYKVVTK